MNEAQEQELRDYIIGSNLEGSFLEQLDDKKHKPFFKKWLGISEDEE